MPHWIIKNCFVTCFLKLELFARITQKFLCHLLPVPKVACTLQIIGIAQETFVSRKEDAFLTFFPHW